MIKLNLGCGKKYLTGWVNCDFNTEIKADVYLDLSKGLPFKNTCVDEVLLDNSLEHIPRNLFFQFIEELHRVCKKGAIIKIFVPHYSGMYASKHLAHYNYFGIGSFDIFSPLTSFNGERYSKARFKIKKEQLLFFHHNLANFKLLSKLPINFIFNFNRIWQQLMERFQIFGFDESYYELEKP
jgi:SAM-dependent methyltransferase